MRKFATTLSVLAIAVSSAFATVSAEVKIASVNMQELYMMFYKRVGVEARLQQEHAGIQDEINKRAEKVKSLEQQLQDLQKQLDPTLPDQKVRQIRTEMLSIKNEYDAELRDLQDFIKRRNYVFKDQQRRDILLLLQEIHDTIKSVAEAEGVDVVLDASASSGMGMTFPYVKPSLSITEKVAAKLNVNAPADFDAKAELQKARSKAAEQQDTPDESDASPAPNPTPAPPVR